MLQRFRFSDGQGTIRDEYGFEARELHSGQGRWLSPDPMPETGNKYVYADNNPLSKVDIYGLLVITSHTGEVASMDETMEAEASDMRESHPPVSTQTDGHTGTSIDSNSSSLHTPPDQQTPLAQLQNGSSLPSSLAMATPSVGGIVSTVKKLFGFGKDAKDMLDAKEEYSYWGKMQEGHLKMRNRDMGNSKDADPMHIGVDNAHLKLDEAERNYYGTKMALTAGGASGGIMFPQLGDRVLFQLKTQIDAAAQNLADETAAYNRAVGAQ